MPYYNKKTITNDFKEIAEEFKDVYNEDIQHFYLYFILCENYTTNDECIKDYYNYGINFFLFNPFVSKYKFKEINVENKSSINLEKIKFILDPSKDYGNINKIEQSIEDDLFKFNTYLFDYKDKIYKDFLNFKNKKKKEKNILVDKYIKDLYKNDKFNNYITSKYMANNYELIDVVELEKYIPSLRFDNDIFIRIIDKEENKDYIIDTSSKEMNIINLLNDSHIDLKIEYNKLSEKCIIIYFKFHNIKRKKFK